MKQITLDHPSGPQFQLDWYDDNSTPSDDQLGSILADDSGMPATASSNMPTSPDSDNLFSGLYHGFCG